MGDDEELRSESEEGEPGASRPGTDGSGQGGHRGPVSPGTGGQVGDNPQSPDTGGGRTVYDPSSSRWKLGSGGYAVGSVSMITGKYARRVSGFAKTIRKEYDMHNEIKTTETDNPFTFPVEHTYAVGTGRILAETTRQLDVSDRNFGSYPTYVFTDAGVFELAGATADAVHSNMSSPTFMEPPVSGVVCQTPYGIAYASRSGLMLLVDTYATTSLTERIWARRREPRYDFFASEELKGLEDFPYREFLQTPAWMVYDPHAEELRVASEAEPSVVLAYNFPTKEWHFMRRLLHGEVLGGNMYPNVRQYAKAGSGISVQRWDESDYYDKVEVVLSSRPLEFGTTYIKNVKRLVLRAWMAGTEEGSWGVGWSESGETFHDVTHGTDPRYPGALHPFWDREREAKSLRDLDSGLLPKDKARFFAVCLRGTMALTSHIQAIEIEHNYTYDGNDKLR